MADNYAVKGAIKGLMAGLRGVTAGKLAIKRAQTEKARKEAEINLENKRFNMEEAKQNFDLQTQLAKRGREAIEFENEQADLKAEQDRAEQLHEQQQGIRERLKTADNRVMMSYLRNRWQQRILRSKKASKWRWNISKKIVHIC